MFERNTVQYQAIATDLQARERVALLDLAREQARARALEEGVRSLADEWKRMAGAAGSVRAVVAQERADSLTYCAKQLRALLDEPAAPAAPGGGHAA